MSPTCGSLTLCRSARWRRALSVRRPTPSPTVTPKTRRRNVPMGIRDILVNGPLCFGTAPLGNMFRDNPDDEAVATVDAAWEHGTRYFDTAPMYGAGLSEIRLGKYLAQHDRDDYVLSTKVGRLILDEIDTEERDSEMFKFGLGGRLLHRRPVGLQRTRQLTISEANVPKTIPKTHENGPRRGVRGPFGLVKATF